MFVEPKEEFELETGHVLFMDVVGYSKLPSNEQREIQRQLNQIVRSTENFLAAEAAGKLIRLPVGDGMALVFFNSREAPVRCALEISEAVKGSPQLKLRVGIHSGPVSTVTDVNDRTNIAGTGINIAQRVMDCGDAGHILLSKQNADDLVQDSEWQPCLHDLGEVEVKHGVRVALANFFGDGFGNSRPPGKIIRAEQVRRRRLLLWLSAILLLLLCLTIGSWVWTRRVALTTAYKIGAAGISEKSIAVLPFENLGEQKENTSFSDGLQDDILTRLAKIADLKVISRSSVMEYRGKRNVREIGNALRVSHVLEGSVQKSGRRLHMNTQLIDTRTDTHVWAEEYDRDLNDLFAVQAEIAQKVAQHLHAKLSASERAFVEERPTRDLVAYDFYVRAVSMIYAAQVPFSVEVPERTLSEAVDLLNEAVARDPNFFLAYCQLAFAHDLIGNTPARLTLAKSAIDSAFRLKPDSGEAHLALAWHLYWGYLDYDRARAELVLAQQSLPNNPRVYELAGSMDRSQRRWVDATHNLERACELDPRNLPYLINLGSMYLWVHDYDDYTKIMDRIVALHPERKPGRIFRASVEVYRRADTGPWRAEIENILTNDPGSEEDPFVAGQRYTLALYDRDWDAAGRAAAVLAQKNSLDAWSIPHLGRDFWVGLVARLTGDETSAHAAFMTAHAQQEDEIRVHSDDFGLISGLGLIDAALGRKEEALREGRRAMELAPRMKDPVSEPYAKRCFAIICAWTGERELALRQLEALTKAPGSYTYGDLRLSPLWDPLRGDPRFEKIVASLAPKGQ